MKTRDKILISIWLLSVGMLAGIFFGRIGYIDKYDLHPINERDSTRIIFHKNIEVDTIYLKGKIIEL